MCLVTKRTINVQNPNPIDKSKVILQKTFHNQNQHSSAKFPQSNLQKEHFSK